MKVNRVLNVFCAFVVISPLLYSCSSTESSSDSTSVDSTSVSVVTDETASLSLVDVCPNPLVIQTDWYPEADHAGTYQLIGTNGTVDKAKGTYSGPLGETGLTLEIRGGGPYIDYASQSQQFYSDKDIFLAYVDTSEAIKVAATTPVVAVMANYEKGPQILMWDPSVNNFENFADIGKSNAKVLFFDGASYMDYLVGSNLLNKNQIDGSYDGSPARFLVEGAKGLVQQGFATAEPYKYENEIEGWKKPIKYLLIHDSGHAIYQSALSARKADLEDENVRSCLAGLVPLMQQSLVDYMTNPEPMNNKISDIVKELDTFWTDSPELNAAATKVMKDLGLVGNGSNGYIGDMDEARVQKLIDELTPTFATKGVEVLAGLKAADIFTNDFISKEIGLGS